MRSGLLLAAAANAFSLCQNPTAARFDSMLEACVLPLTTIEFIDDPKHRTLFRGVAAAAERQEVRTAFAIVYQDLGPVRVAGDIIFSQLQRVASRATAGAAEMTETP